MCWRGQEKTGLYDIMRRARGNHSLLTTITFRLVMKLWCTLVDVATLSCPDKPSGSVNRLNPELNPICYLLALLAHHFLHVSRIRVKSLTIRLLMSYIYIYIYIYDISNLRVKTAYYTLIQSSQKVQTSYLFLLLLYCNWPKNIILELDQETSYFHNSMG